MRKVKTASHFLALSMAVLPIIFFTSCGILNPPDINANGYYPEHYNCCGPTALERAFRALYVEHGIVFKKGITSREISEAIQRKGNRGRDMLSIINRNAVCITWPSEIKNTARDYGFIPVSLRGLNELKEGDVAIILVQGRVSKGEFHWMCFPYCDVDAIKKWYGKTTKIGPIYLLRSR